jgi:hypothetical protein
MVAGPPTEHRTEEITNWQVQLCGGAGDPPKKKEKVP